MNGPIAIVGLACVFPDARTPMELWENVLAQRRAFRRLPAERLRAEDYFSEDPQSVDRTYAAEAAVIEGYEFDRVGFRVVGSTYRSADLAHWLALDVAARALDDAGYGEGTGLPRESTGVVLGNTLTGEFSRANVLRLRWPYVRRVLEAALSERDWPADQRREFLEQVEDRYKAPFPAVGEETLAGGLSNTIAGRICNQFDLKGGGYTIDGACASSLLAVANACSALAAGDLDVALAGGVDLSLDPFELVGFAKTGALAPEQMRVYDTRSAGFWPGEGCGFAVLMRHADALAQQRRVYAVIRGWGISSDGSGGITRPEIDGQIQALRRAYHRAGYGIDTVEYFEGHGTGTSVGDATELKVISSLRREAAPGVAPAAIGSVKANIGHTKAAAGIAGLIKATLALHTKTLPPTTGCDRPHAELCGSAPALRILREAETWPAQRPLRASVSAMGFGGINSHLTLEGAEVEAAPTTACRSLSWAAQDAEIILLGAETSEELRRQVDHLVTFAGKLSQSELTDLAAALERRLSPRPLLRAAIVAASPSELSQRLRLLQSWLEEPVETRLDFNGGVFLSSATTAPRIGFLFPGQGVPMHLGGGAYCRRFDCAREWYANVRFPDGSDETSTAMAQPALVAACVAGLRVLRQLGLDAVAAVGHSLGEMAALHWAGVMDESTLLRLATVRGRAMAELGRPDGAMAALATSSIEVKPLLTGTAVSIVGFNSPRQTVVAGEAPEVARVMSRAQARGLAAVMLPVSHAFHTPMVAAAAPVLEAQLTRESFLAPQRRVCSTVSASVIESGDDIRALLLRQVTSPVRFLEALGQFQDEIDLWIEVGPGQVLTKLAHDFVRQPVASLDAGGASLTGLLRAVGAAFALGAPVDHAALFRGRFSRPFALDWQPKFFANPCESAPISTDSAPRARPAPSAPAPAPTVDEELLPLELIRRLVAARAELPVAAVKDDSRLLKDLHLNSITVGQLVAEAAGRLHLPPLIGLTDFAHATVSGIARALEELDRHALTHGLESRDKLPQGLDSWIRTFTITRTACPRPAPVPREGSRWQVIGSPDQPLGETLRAVLRHAPGMGVVVCLPEARDEQSVKLLLEGARAVRTLREAGTECQFVLVQGKAGAAGFARTLFLEWPEVTTSVVTVPFDHPKAAAYVRDEILGAAGFHEAHYDESGVRSEPRLRWLPLAEGAEELPIRAGDVVLVTGGGKGITAECALALARRTGARLALLGRSRFSSDAELSANLGRMTAAGVQCRYFEVDVTRREAVRLVLAQIEQEWGTIQGLLHGAGTNTPQTIGALDEAGVRRTLAPKIDGLRNVLGGLDASQLRLLVTFGSIIARTGLPGEADYALANEWLSELTGEFQSAHPACRCVAMEWSVWSGLGMGQKLGRIEALRQSGVTPIPPEEGTAIFLRLLEQKLPGTSIVITGRYGELPTLKVEKPELPFLRFLEKPRVFFPGIELIADTELSAENDPYLDDHVYHGERLFPAVLGLEAMAQAAMALVGSSEAPRFENAQWRRPIVAPRQGKVTLRVVALARSTDLVEVALRSQESGFQIDHFSATCRFARPDSVDGREQALASLTLSTPESTAPPGQLAVWKTRRVTLDPVTDLYRDLLFHTGRFQRVLNFRLLRARECVVEVEPDTKSTWFGRYLPQERVLGDSGVRDAAIHAIQACIPHARLLPISVGCIVIGRIPCLLERIAARGPIPELLLHARERRRDGDTFHYDLALLGEDGSVLEQWEDLALRKVEDIPRRTPWTAALLRPYLERRMEELMPGSKLSVLIANGAGDRAERSRAAIQELLGTTVPVQHRLDGRPEVPGAPPISVAHANDLTLAVSGPGLVGADLEVVKPRPAATWRELLGLERLQLAQQIAREANEEVDTAATRLWVAGECLKKAGAPDAPLTLAGVKSDGWVLLGTGSITVAIGVVTIDRPDNRVAVGIATPS